MKAILAGTMAWAIEVSIAILLLYLVRREERKVIKRR